MYQKIRIKHLSFYDKEMGNELISHFIAISSVICLKNDVNVRDTRRRTRLNRGEQHYNLYHTSLISFMTNGAWRVDDNSGDGDRKMLHPSIVGTTG